MKKFEYKDYPALYQASDTVSNETQNTYLLLMKLNIWLLITAALFSFIGINSKAWAVAAAFVFVITIIINVVLMIKNFPDTWYRARSIAESIKTISWRFMMKTDPFRGLSLKDAREKFSKIQKAILNEQDKEILEKFDPSYHTKDAITETMLKTFEDSINNKIEIYRINRVEEQRNWYSNKTKYNQSKYRFWFSIMILVQIIAVATVICRVAVPDFKYWPPEVLSVIAGGILTWIQVKKYRELAAAYSFTAHEIGILGANIDSIGTEEELTNFVQDAENAFSREHTQWIARKDNF